MQPKSLFDSIPVWLLFAGTVFLVLIAIEGGFHLALFRLRKQHKLDDGPVSSVIGSTLGLLAFLLAFTFGMTASRFDTRRQLLLDEVNAIGTCYLRAGMIPDSESKAVRALLCEYVHLRAELSHQLPQMPQILKRSEAILDEAWLQAMIVANIDRDSEMYSLFIVSLNDVIDFHTKRVVVSQYRIPNGIWLALYVLATLSMASVGYQFGLRGRRDIAINLCLAISFSIVIWLIADLEHGFQGALTVSQQPMIELDQKLNSSTR